MEQTVIQRELTPPDAAQASSAVQSIGSRMRVGIGSFGAWMLGVGSIIGSMAWLMHGPMLARAGSAACMTAWMIAGIVSLPLALILMELSSMFPSAGGPYVYKYYALKRLVPRTGELFGFLTGWLFLISIIVGLACMSCGLANLMSSCFYAGKAPIWFGPLVIVLLFSITTGLNLMPVARASKISVVFTLLKFALAAGFAFIVLSAHQWSIGSVYQSVAPATAGGGFVENVSSVLMLALAGFAFLELSGCTASETHDAARTVPRAMFLTLLSVTAIYLSMCFCVSIAAPYVVTADKSSLVVVGTNIQATCPALAGLLAGDFWGRVFSLLVVSSIAGCSFTGLMGIARVSYSMAETRLFPRQFSALCARTGVPKHALWFQFWCVVIIGVTANVLSHSGIFPDAYTFLAEIFGFLYSFVAMLYGFCLISLRYTDPHLPRPFRIGMGGNKTAWFVSLVTLLIWGYAAFGCVKPMHQITGFLILLSGIPIYCYYKSRNT